MKRNRSGLLLLGCIIYLVASSSAFAQLIGYWPLDGNATASVGTNGAMGGSPTGTTDRFGTTNGALAFNGSSWVSLSSGGGLDGLSTFSIAFWVKWSGAGQDVGYANTNYGAVTGRQNNGEFGPTLFSERIISLTTADPATGKIAWHPFDFGGFSVSSPNPPGNGVWTHVAITVSGTTSHSLYIDGSLAASGTSTTQTFFTNPSAPLTIGAWLPNGASYSTASVDDFRIYNTALSDSEVAAVYAIPEPSTYAALAGLGALGLAVLRRRRRLLPLNRG